MSSSEPPNNSTQSPQNAAPRRQLGLFDSTCMIVGIIIGAFFYETSPTIASCMTRPSWLIGAWVLGGLISLIGAVCYAELATAYPREGGDYYYLSRAFGRRAGFLFAWAQFWIVRPGAIGTLCWVFARYANRLWVQDGSGQPSLLCAILPVLVLTEINIVGVRAGKWTQNVLTSVKVLGMGGIVVVGLWFAMPDATSNAAIATADAASNADEAGAEAGESGSFDFYLAMILILYTFGGWNEMAYVGAEVRRPEKNILRTLVSGTVAVTAIYVLVTLVFLHALGYRAMCKSEAVAADVVNLAPGNWGGPAISLLICLSVLGAIHGMIFAGARIYYAMGREHRLYAWLGRWDEHSGTPVWSLGLQALITLAIVVAFGRSNEGFQRLVNFTTPVFWIFFLLVGISLFVLRYREPNTPRPYRVPWYPFVPILFCLSSLFMVHASISWAIANRASEAYWAIGILAVGLILAMWDRDMNAELDDCED